MNRSQLFISTIDPNAGQTAAACGVGVEIAEFCTAWNMDEQFEAADAALKKTLKEVPSRVMHGPFNELFPCAIDPKVRRIAADRYRQALALARHYKAEKLILHGGYNPWLYYPVWYKEQSILFWKDFLKDAPPVPIVLENVLEPDPQMLLEIVQAVDHPMLRLCLDVGHVNAYSPIPASQWLQQWAPYLSHFHLHNNDGPQDSHQALDEGTLPMAQLLEQAQRLCPRATYTLELMDAAPSLDWLFKNL